MQHECVISMVIDLSTWWKELSYNVKIYLHNVIKYSPHLPYTLLHIGGKESTVMDLCTQMLATRPNGKSVHGSMHAKQSIQ